MATKSKATKKAKKVSLFPKGGKPKTTAKFVSLSVTAVIPVQAYGNIQPKIEVSASTFEEARDFAMARIAEFYDRYAETKPAFLGKIEVKEVVVAAPATKALSTATVAPAAAAPAEAAPAPALPKPEPVLKAEKALERAMTEDAAIIIQDQIEKSTKIPTEFKQDLLKLCLQRRKALSK